MKWFKHFSTAMDDLFVKDLERKFGDTGYAFWFKTLELIAAHGKDGVLKISWQNYCDKLSKRRDHLRRILTFATQDGHLTFAENSEDSITITCSRFIEIADNFTKYGRELQSNFKVPLKQEEEEEGDKKEKKKRIYIQHPSSALEITPYFEELSMTTNDAGEFFDHYTANGWVQGKNKPIVDWRAAARNWKRNKEKFNATINTRKAGKQSEQIQRASFEHTDKDVKRFAELEATLTERQRDRDKRA